MSSCVGGDSDSEPDGKARNYQTIIVLDVVGTRGTSDDGSKCGFVV